jgi:hypothetical protein
MVISTRAGMHRVSWDMRYQPIGAAGGRGAGGAAVPHRTHPAASAPWAPPGSYVVRLTAGGKRYTQPLTLRLDPRVKTPALALATQTRLTREMYDGARATDTAFEQARALAAQLGALEGSDMAAFKAKVAVDLPALEGASAAMMAAAMAMQTAEAAPTARDVAACRDARRQATTVMAHWTTLKTADLAALNAKRKAAGQPMIEIAKR